MVPLINGDKEDHRENGNEKNDHRYDGCDRKY